MYEQKVVRRPTKALSEKYIHDPSLDDFFSPIRLTKNMRKSLTDKTTTDKDGPYFNRMNCEEHLFKVHSMFGLSNAPIMKALSKLLELPDNSIAKEARSLLGDGLKGMSQGWHEITSA